MTHTLLRLENVPDRNECFVQVLFTDADTGASIPYAQWITGAAYDEYQAAYDEYQAAPESLDALIESLDALIAGWEAVAKQQYYDSSAITPRQARLALLNAGLLDVVEAYIAQASRSVQIEWEFANAIRRDWPPVVQAASALGLSNEHVDALFTAAARL